MRSPCESSWGFKDFDHWLRAKLGLEDWAEDFAKKEKGTANDGSPVYGHWQAALQHFAFDEDGWGSDEGWQEVKLMGIDVVTLFLLTDPVSNGGGEGEGVTEGNGGAAEEAAHTSASNEVTQQTQAQQQQAGPRSTLPRDKYGNYLPDPAAEGRAHPTIGTGGNGTYRQGATFDESGRFIGRTDVSDHGLPDTHTNPRFHPATSPNSVEPGSHPLPPPPPPPSNE